MAKTFTIDDVIRRASVKSACTEEQARLVIAQAFRLLNKHGEPDAVRAVVERIPGAEALAGADSRPRRRTDSSKPSGGLSWTLVADGTAMLMRFKAAGIERVTAKRLVRSVRTQVEAETGQDLVGDALRTVPGVSERLGD